MRHSGKDTCKFRAACDSCNDAKVRCSKTRPTCVRCGRKRLPCIYGASRRAGRRSAVPMANNTATEESNSFDITMEQSATIFPKSLQLGQSSPQISLSNILGVHSASTSSLTGNEDVHDKEPMIFDLQAWNMDALYSPSISHSSNNLLPYVTAAADPVGSGNEIPGGETEGKATCNCHGQQQNGYSSYLIPILHGADISTDIRLIQFREMVDLSLRLLSCPVVGTNPTDLLLIGTLISSGLSVLEQVLRADTTRNQLPRLSIGQFQIDVDLDYSTLRSGLWRSLIKKVRCALTGFRSVLCIMRRSGCESLAGTIAEGLISMLEEKQQKLEVEWMVSGADFNIDDLVSGIDESNTLEKTCEQQETINESRTICSL
ncbi:hypothetical protein TESG_04131 [Trichophyton tonsurans CBS 112818]|uniref:Zn(2)-C6 fungal-type domain-containing protein n=1 Tax=Trichophyton tonsurans (strain CBS 112818) TaxID=647933 RepID=F2RZF0_TRIT1|nr:hypothetical protein TESG_04131 [Trichophyton tonsurans CBS 112818]